MKCILCNSDVEVINGKIKYHYCSCCKIIFKDKSFHLTEFEEKQRYEQHNNNYSDDFANYFKTFIDNSVLPYISKTSLGLDYGCGSNRVLEQVFKEFYDISVDSYDKYFTTNIVNKQYDFITCTEVIEHVYHPLEFVREMLTYLKTGGILIIMTQFHDNNLVSFINWWYVRDITHITFYNETTFKYLANVLNLDVIKCCNNTVVLRKKEESDESSRI